MANSIFDFFTTGLGPSSTHTVGPMIASNRFTKKLIESDKLTSTNSI